MFLFSLCFSALVWILYAPAVILARRHFACGTKDADHPEVHYPGNSTQSLHSKGSSAHQNTLLFNESTDFQLE